MLRKYGRAPYRAALIHGGPGARGSLSGVARRLSLCAGVLEPIQSRCSVSGLAEELHEQLAPFSDAPLVLLGHSWGAMLSLLHAAQHPDKIRRLILTGCPPLTPDGTEQITPRRLARLSSPQADEFRQLLRQLETDAPGQDARLARLGELAERADRYDLLPDDTPDADYLPPDAHAFSAVWPQAAALRRQGAFLRAAELLTCPVTLIQGEQDPHPADAVIRAFKQAGKPLETYLLPRCGHAPFQERYARDAFFDLVENYIREAVHPK